MALREENDGEVPKGALSDKVLKKRRDVKEGRGNQPSET